MSFFLCPSCGHESHIFGHDGARQWAEKVSVPFLGNIPINLSIREQGDAGTPAVVAEETPEEVREAFRSVASQVAAQMSKRNLSSDGAEPLELKG